MSPDLAVFVVMVEVVQTDMALPAARVTTCGVGVGGGGAAGLFIIVDEGEVEETFDPGEPAPGFDDPPLAFDATAPLF